MEKLNKKELSYNNFSLSTSINLGFWIELNHDFICKNYAYLFEEATSVTKYVQSENEAIEWYSKKRKERYDTVNEIIDLLDLEYEFNGATSQQVLEFLKESERIEYAEIGNILQSMNELPDRA